MNRFVTLLALAIALGGPASAGAISPYIAPLGINNADVVAGQVSADGRIERGSGFRVHLNAFTYTINFDRRYFPSGCAALVASPTTAQVVAVVSQHRCGGPFHVNLYFPGQSFTTGEFQFIAREDAPPIQ
jgi:hypothetical protein